MHGLRQRAAPVNRQRSDALHLRRDPRLCGVAQLKVIRAAATGCEALATDLLVSLKEERAIKLLRQARAPQRDRFNEQEAYPPCLRISAHFTNRLPYDRPLQLFQTAQYCRIGKRLRGKERTVDASIWATRLRHHLKDRVAKRHIGRARHAKQRIGINVFNSTTNGLM
jgi:hypothetical protein